MLLLAPVYEWKLTTELLLIYHHTALKRWAYGHKEYTNDAAHRRYDKIFNENDAADECGELIE